MKRIARALEAIPLHLTLPIIRFDDALGESWGLPFQACTRWHVSLFSNNCEGYSHSNDNADLQRHVSDRCFRQ